MYLRESSVKKLAKAHKRRVGRDFMRELDIHIEETIKKACSVHNGSKITLDESVFFYVSGKCNANILKGNRRNIRK